MFEKPPPDGNLVVEISASIAALAPGGRKVEPTAVRYGQEAGNWGAKTSCLIPKQFDGVGSPFSPATPESPAEAKTVTPCRPSFAISAHCRRWYEIGRSDSAPP
jgi:hypothetical protein